VYRQGDRIKALITKIEMTGKGPQIILSRTNPLVLAELFEAEVPEIAEGIVEIKGVVRETGSRSKIAVYSHDNNVDPVGACVGMRGARVQNVVSELRGEKIDIIPWSEDIARFACNALAPAVVSKIYIVEETKSMEIIVADDQLSLAIGKRGQNVRLAARLTGWKIDIKSETRAAEAEMLEYASFDGSEEESQEDAATSVEDAQSEPLEQAEVSAEDSSEESAAESTEESAEESEE
jgi:N utilization substance protein A